MPTASEQPNLARRMRPYLFCFGVVALSVVICLALLPWLHHRVVALLLLLCISLLAMRFEVMPVLLAATASAASWNFFFIPPRFTFNIGEPEDVLLFGMYFVVSALNAVLSRRIRQANERYLAEAQRTQTLGLYQTLLNSLSHELRTPIATIVGGADTLQHDFEHLDHKSRQTLLHDMRIASHRLDRAVGNLLNMSRLEAGVLKPRPDWCELSEILAQLKDRLSTDFPTHPLAIQAPPHLPLLRLDHGLLTEALYNLLTNAAQHSPPQAPIHLQATLEQGGILMITIIDQGPGFPEAYISRLFEKFYRPPMSPTGGTGLGLSIVKGLLEAMGGTVQIANGPSGGAMATISLPVDTNYLNQLNHD